MSFIEERIKYIPFQEKVMTAQEAASYIKDGMTISIPEFGSFYNPMAICNAITDRVVRGGETLRLSLIKTAVANSKIEEEWTKNGIMARRMVFIQNPMLREKINTNHGVEFVDAHLSRVPDKLRHGQYGKLDYAIVACAGVTEDGKLIPTFDQGYTPVALQSAEKVLIEISTDSITSLYPYHDVYVREKLPNNREPYPIMEITDRIGEHFYTVDPDKVVGIVISDTPMTIMPMWNVAESSEEQIAIANNFADFLENEVAAGRMPKNLLPLQTGAGRLADAALEELSRRFEHLNMYTEGFQGVAAKLFLEGKIDKVSTGSFSLDRSFLDILAKNADTYSKRLVIRGSEISNNADIISRLGVIAMNNILEADLYGNVNSTHIMGTRMVAGVGGSGDFARNAYLTVFFTLSTAKGGNISSIVPMCSHVDHTEHDVDIIVTEYGIADLRGKSPRERAGEMIRIAHPEYREMLQDYFDRAVKACGPGNCHTPHLMGEALSWHDRFLVTGSMKK